MPVISGNEKITFSIITSKKAINITSVFEKAIPAAKLLWENTFIKTYVKRIWKIDPRKHKKIE